MSEHLHPTVCELVVEDVFISDIGWTQHLKSPDAPEKVVQQNMLSNFNFQSWQLLTDVIIE